MNYPRLILAAFGGTLAYFVCGFLSFAVLPLKQEFQKYPEVFRNEEGIKSVMPLGMLGILVSIFVLAILYAMIYRGGSGLAEGLRFGALIGLFAFGAFVLHNYVNLNIGLKLTFQQAAAYFVEWIVVGVAIGLLYRPLTPLSR